MAELRAGVIGCGGRGRAHAAGYAAAKVPIVACADPVPESSQALAEKYGVPKVYADYRELLERERPEIVSICTWPAQHREMVEAAVAAGARAIHCEKPMAPTWGDSRAMHQVCEARGVQLTLCHQRRFSAHFVRARQLLREGAIGELVRIEGACSNLYDWGTHWFDMMHFFQDEKPAAWVMGQIDVAHERRVFGVPVETGGLSYVKWPDGVTGLLTTGADPTGAPANRIFTGEGIWLTGTEGWIEVGILRGPRLRVRRFGRPDETPSLEGVAPPVGETELSVINLVECLRTGEEPELSSRRALRATELIFATYESARRRARVHLPLEIEDSPLLTMLENGDLAAPPAPP